ncbi:sugar transferase [Microbacterium lacusdiani]
MTTVGIAAARLLPAPPVLGAHPASAPADDALPAFDAPVPVARASLSRRRARDASHRRRLLVTDAAMASGACAAVALASPALAAPAAATAALWCACLVLARSHDPWLTPRGELARVAAATAAALGLIAVAAVAGVLPLDAARVVLAVGAPIGAVAIATGRIAWRSLRGSSPARAVVVGRAADVATVEHEIARIAASPVRVCGAVVFDADDAGDAVVGTVADAVDRVSADTVLVAGTPDGVPAFLRRLAWAVEGRAADVLSWSGLTDVAAARLSVSASGALPMLRLRVARYDGPRRAAQRVFDVVVASLALIPVGLLAVPIAIAIRLDSPGPVLYRQERIGEGGRPFRMLKFRSMSVDADRRSAALMALNDAAGPLFKVREDPRVTRVGRVLRRCSLDELPQFWNVLRGDMSVIGPRPALPREVAQYTEDERRRLYVRPGISGPWQVGGRSTLSWEDGIRLDLGYTENRSIPGDVALLFRTVTAVLTARGAF